MNRKNPGRLTVKQMLNKITKCNANQKQKTIKNTSEMTRERLETRFKRCTSKDHPGSVWNYAFTTFVAQAFVQKPLNNYKQTEQNAPKSKNSFKHVGKTTKAF